MFRILVIDDDKPILEMLEIGLTKFGYEVEIASGGLEGLRKFEEGSFDVVITDIHMPDVDGYDVARGIRKISKTYTPVVAISGMIQDLEFDDFDHVFPKPFLIQNLADAIEELIREKDSLKRLPEAENEERRRYKRVLVEGKTDAVLWGPGFSKTVQIVDIGRGGLAFRYVNGRKPLGSPLEIDIYWDHAGLYLANLKIEMVSDCESDDGAILDAFPVRRCRAAFVQLTEEQLLKLKGFLGNS